MACSAGGAGAPADPGGGVQGDPGHCVVEEEAPPATEVDGAAFPGRPALLTSHVASGRRRDVTLTLQVDHRKKLC